MKLCKQQTKQQINLLHFKNSLKILGTNKIKKIMILSKNKKLSKKRILKFKRYKRKYLNIEVDK